MQNLAASADTDATSECSETASRSSVNSRGSRRIDGQSPGDLLRKAKVIFEKRAAIGKGYRYCITTADWPTEPYHYVSGTVLEWVHPYAAAPGHALASPDEQQSRLCCCVMLFAADGSSRLRHNRKAALKTPLDKRIPPAAPQNTPMDVGGEQRGDQASAMESPAPGSKGGSAVATPGSVTGPSNTSPDISPDSPQDRIMVTSAKVRLQYPFVCTWSTYDECPVAEDDCFLACP